ncbi:TetR family transcriptional regulator (plasmid) [Sulfitobacter alexandrii]|uniref:TetR family transcriptional regulator n=1 Tax=Sulfitobacter alexandrii TaxID=1917485 RepID=A0A1J0WNL6_9RHOB|nr:TetR/AcrR family transcriptional regulator [Sulfitobacter alexandrii]APE45948.1 TetR family transcriptional regulator [Sulfitobacter alexandrii]
MAASDRREAILDAAQALFMERGWEIVTIADVLEAAGISRGGFYHHFTAKEDLLTQIVARLTQQAMVAAEAARDQTAGDALARLNAFIAGSLRSHAENPESLQVFAEVLARPGNDILFQRIFEANSAMIQPILTGMIVEGVEDGTFDVADPALTAEVIVGLAQGRRQALSRILTAALAGNTDAATAELDTRMLAEGLICDRLLGLPQGSVVLSDKVAYHRMLAGLANRAS